MKNILTKIRLGAHAADMNDEFAREIRESDYEARDDMRWFCGMNVMRVSYPCALL